MSSSKEKRLWTKCEDSVNKFTKEVPSSKVLLMRVSVNPKTNKLELEMSGDTDIQEHIKGDINGILNCIKTTAADTSSENSEPTPSTECLTDVAKTFGRPLSRLPTDEARRLVATLVFESKLIRGFGKDVNPHWGKEDYRAPWWPEDLTWSNPRKDFRPEENRTTKWADEVRRICRSAYVYHNMISLTGKHLNILHISKNKKCNNYTCQERM